MWRPASVPLAVFAFAALVLAACPKQDVTPLIGEPPEVYELLGESPADDPRTSPVAAARRLHQALIQQDTDLAWALLARPTRLALDERGAAIGVSGRELLDGSTLPAPGGIVKRVRWERVFFGPDVVDLVATQEPSPDADRAIVRAVSEDGTTVERTFVRGPTGWRLRLTELP